MREFFTRAALIEAQKTQQCQLEQRPKDEQEQGEEGVTPRVVTSPSLRSRSFMRHPVLVTEAGRESPVIHGEDESPSLLDKHLF